MQPPPLPRTPVLPCGRCGKPTASSELRCLWRGPVWAMSLFLARPRDEGGRLYCPACRRLLNRCVLFLALLAIAALLIELSALLSGR
jgi:hypothetical protein